MIKNRYKLLGLIMCILILCSGCSLIDIEASNSITKIFDDEQIDYNSFSKSSRQALYEIQCNHFLEALESDESDFISGIRAVNLIYSIATDNTFEISALNNATFEDIIIMYDISVANANAASIYYAIKQYCNECALNDSMVKSGTHINKISNTVSNKEVKYNGKNSDMNLFINKYINIEARNGYYNVNINEFGAPICVYWSSEKKQINDEDNLETYYNWDMEELQNGKKLIGVYPGSFYYSNTVSVRVAQETSLSSSIATESDIFSIDADKKIYNNLVKIFEKEIDNAINEIDTDKSEAENKTYTEEQLNALMATANSNAKLAYTNAATYISQCEVKGNTVDDNWYIADLNNQADSYEKNGLELPKALSNLMGMPNGGYACVKIENGVPVKSCWCRNNIFNNVDLDSLPDKIECNGDPIVGSYPNLSVVSDKHNVILSDENYEYNATQNVIEKSDDYSKTINPFDGLVIEYDGASPYLKASVNTSGCSDEVRKYVSFSITDEPLSKGDGVTVEAKWDESAAIDNNINFSKSTQEYVVDNVSYYLDTLDGVDISELNQLMDDFVEAEANKGVNSSSLFKRSVCDSPWFDDQCNWVHQNRNLDKINNQQVVREYFLSYKQSSTLDEDKIYNKYIRIYEVSYDAHCNSYYSTGTAIVAVFMDNIVMGADGKLLYNSTEPLNSNQLYYEDGDTVATLESNYVIAQKAQYNVAQMSKIQLSKAQLDEYAKDIAIGTEKYLHSLSNSDQSTYYLGGETFKGFVSKWGLDSKYFETDFVIENLDNPNIDVKLFFEAEYDPEPFTLYVTGVELYVNDDRYSVEDDVYGEYVK